MSDESSKTATADTTPGAQVDYFNATGDTYQVFFPDGITYIECKKLTEGDRTQYQKAITKDIRVERGTGSAFFSMSTGEERAALIEAAAIDWNLIRDGKPVPFRKGSKGSELNKFILQAPPEIIDHVEAKIKEHEPWLLDNLDVEEIEKEIDRLEDLKQKAKDREEGKGS